MLIKEKQRRECLILSLGRHLLLHCQVRQKRLGLLLVGERRWQCSTEIVISTDPATIRDLRAIGEMEQADLRSNQNNDFVPGLHGE